MEPKGKASARTWIRGSEEETHSLEEGGRTDIGKAHDQRGPHLHGSSMNILVNSRSPICSLLFSVSVVVLAVAASFDAKLFSLI